MQPSLSVLELSRCRRPSGSVGGWGVGSGPWEVLLKVRACVRVCFVRLTTGVTNWSTEVIYSRLCQVLTAGRGGHLRESVRVESDDTNADHRRQVVVPQRIALRIPFAVE